MIGSGLIRFHPSVERPQDGYGLTDTTWKTIKEVGPTLLRDVITASAMAGVKGLKEVSKTTKLIGEVVSQRLNEALSEKPNKNSTNLSEKKHAKVFSDFETCTLFTLDV